MSGDTQRDGWNFAILATVSQWHLLECHYRYSEKTKACCALQVEEIKRHSHCLAFSSPGPQSQTYYLSFDSYTEHLRWHRTASKVLLCSLLLFKSSFNYFECLQPVSLTLLVCVTTCHWFAPPTFSDCISASELSRSVLLQPGGAACSALLQPRPHAPQPQKQLHITA